MSFLPSHVSVTSVLVIDIGNWRNRLQQRKALHLVILARVALEPILFEIGQKVAQNKCDPQFQKLANFLLTAKIEVQTILFFNH